jgi:uncharacterized protein
MYNLYVHFLKIQYSIKTNLCFRPKWFNRYILTIAVEINPTCTLKTGTCVSTIYSLFIPLSKAGPGYSFGIMYIKSSELSGQAISNHEMFDLANRFLASLKNSDWELLRLIITADCIWRLPGTTMISGVAFGADAIVKRATQIVNKGLNLELLHIQYGMNGFALSLHNQENNGELIIDEYLTMTCTLRGYMISSINTYLSDMEGLDSFFHF